MASPSATVSDMSKADQDPDAEKATFRLDGVDVRRTDAILSAQPGSLIRECKGNRSMLWRLVYRAGLDALERNPKALLGSDPDATPRMEDLPQPPKGQKSRPASDRKPKPV